VVAKAANSQLWQKVQQLEAKVAQQQQELATTEKKVAELKAELHATTARHEKEVAGLKTEIWRRRRSLRPSSRLRRPSWLCGKFSTRSTKSVEAAHDAD